MPVNHAFVSPKADGADATKVRPSDWNASHILNLDVSEIANAVPDTRNLTAGTGLTGGGDLKADRTLNVVANADGSIVVNPNDIQVGVLATDAQHGNRGGSGIHALVIASGNAGFMSGADKTKLDGLVSSVYSTSEKLALEMEMEFKVANLSNYRVNTYDVLNQLIDVDIWTSPTMVTLLFHKDLTYVVGNLTQTVLTRTSDGSTLTRTFGYTGLNLTSVTAVAA